MGWRLEAARRKAYDLLERPSSLPQILYHLGVFSFVLITLSLSALLSSLDRHGHRKGEPPAPKSGLHRAVFGMEVTLAAYFALELCARLACVGYAAAYAGWRGRLRYLCRFIVIVDLVILAGTVTLLVWGTDEGRFLGSGTVQNLRFLQILRLLHIDRGASTWKIMEKILTMHRTELISAYYLTLLGLLVMSTLVYLTELYHEEQGHIENTFENYGDALWWGVITLMAVGYGDIVPKWWVSKVLTAVCAMLCVSLFTLISSVIGVGLTLMVQDRERQKHQAKQRPRAAALIQSYYRASLLRRKFTEITYYRKTLTQKLLAHELETHLNAAHVSASSHRGHHKGAHHMVDVLRRTTGRLGHLHMPHRPHLHRPHLHRHGGGSHQEPATRPRALFTRRLSEDARFGMRRTESAVLAVTSPHLENEHTRSGSQPVLFSSRDSDYSSAESSPGPPEERHLENWNQRDSKRSTQSDTQAWALDFDETMAVPMRYQLALRAVWELRWRAAKRAFRRARRPYELADISEEVSESEQHQLAKLREVQNHVEHVIGRPGLSLLTKDQQQLGILQRLQLVEAKMADLDKKADLILELATQVGERIISINKEARLAYGH